MIGADQLRIKKAVRFTSYSSHLNHSAQSRRPSLPDSTYNSVAAENASRHSDVYVPSFRPLGERYFPHRVSDHLVAHTVR